MPTDPTPPVSGRCPMTTAAITDAYFLEHRAKLLDLAAFLDRLDRAVDADTATPDYRIAAFRAAIDVLQSNSSARAKRVLEVFSDPTDTPIAAAPGKGASGAYPGDIH